MIVKKKIDVKIDRLTKIRGLIIKKPIIKNLYL